MPQTFIGTDVAVPAVNPEPNPSGVALVCLVVKREFMTDQLKASIMVGYFSGGNWVEHRQDFRNHNDALAQMIEARAKAGHLFCRQCGAILENEQCPSCPIVNDF